jgi:Xaa-Pro aminopeptidase
MPMMRMTERAALFLLAASVHSLFGADQRELEGRRRRAANAFTDGILLVHARSAVDQAADGFRQDPAFFYFTGLENTSGAILAIDGQSRESWLFLPDRALYSKILTPEGSADSLAVKQTGIENVVNWSELKSLLTRNGTSGSRLYYVAQHDALAELPPNITGRRTQHPAPDASDWTNPREMPSWVVIIANTWPSLQIEEAGDRVYALMDVPSESEMISVRSAAKLTVTAVMAGLHAIAPGASQRTVETTIQVACWKAGGHGSVFWPWAMAGANSVYPRPHAAEVRYDHLDGLMQPGDLVRLNAGCEVDHYFGELGRTVPVSGRFSRDQRDLWTVFVAAYHAGVASLREGVTADLVFDAWRAGLLRQRPLTESALVKHAIDEWSTRGNVPYWQLYTLNPVEGDVHEPLRVGTTVGFEPIASAGGQGYFLVDMFVIRKDGAELLTPGLPYSADEIETAMRPRNRSRR